jgi:hypothetical protein
VVVGAEVESTAALVVTLATVVVAAAVVGGAVVSGVAELEHPAATTRASKTGLRRWNMAER